MALSDSDKRLLSYVGVGIKSTKYALIRLNMTGQLNQNRYYLADVNDANMNPIQAPTSDEYFTHLKTHPAINLLSWTRKDGSKRTQIYKSDIPINTSGVRVDVTPKYMWGIPPAGSSLVDVAGYGTYTDTKTFIIKDPIIVPWKECDGITASSVAAGTPFRRQNGGYIFNYNQSDYGARVGSAYAYFAPSEVKQYAASDGNDTGTINDTCEWPEIISSNGLGNIFLLMARAGLCKVDDFVTNVPLGVMWTSWNTNNASRTVTHPKIAGTRRVGVFINMAKYGESTTGGSWYTVAFTGYLWGEGDDVFAYCTGSLNGTTVTKKIAFGLFGADPEARIGYAGAIKRDVSGYPLDGIAMLNNSVVGKLTQVGNEKFTFNNSEVEVLDYELECDYATGSIQPSDYYNYLTTGVGLYKPRTPEEAQKTLASWSALTSGLYYKVQTCNLTNTKLTLKDTTYYKDYARMRAKACKDNDYMELKYNDYYQMKTVQNKLEALGSRAIWIQNGASMSSLGAGSKSYSAGSITVAASTLESKFKATIYPRGETSFSMEFAKTEDGIDAMVSAYPGYTINDPDKIITGLLGTSPDGGTLGDANAALVFNDLKYDLRPVTFIAGVAPCYDDLVAVGATNDAKVSLLASQVTDFAKFEGVIQRWLNDFSQRSVINTLMTVRNDFRNIKVDEIVVNPV